MTHRITGLECRVTDYIEQTYKAKFLGEVHVDISPNGVYTLELVLNNYMAPLVMSFECESDEQFFDKVTDQISKRDLIRVQFFNFKINEGIQKRQ